MLDYANIIFSTPAGATPKTGAFRWVPSMLNLLVSEQRLNLPPGINPVPFDRIIHYVDGLGDITVERHHSRIGGLDVLNIYNNHLHYMCRERSDHRVIPLANNWIGINIDGVKLVKILDFWIDKYKLHSCPFEIARDKQFDSIHTTSWTDKPAFRVSYEVRKNTDLYR